MKYQNFLSRRKYALVCKTQSSVFDLNSDLWVSRNMKCLGTDWSLYLNMESGHWPC